MPMRHACLVDVVKYVKGSHALLRERDIVIRILKPLPDYRMLCSRVGKASVYEGRIDFPIGSTVYLFDHTVLFWMEGGPPA
jgi:hypothetical protein